MPSKQVLKGSDPLLPLTPYCRPLIATLLPGRIYRNTIITKLVDELVDNPNQVLFGVKYSEILDKIQSEDAQATHEGIELLGALGQLRFGISPKELSDFQFYREKDTTSISLKDRIQEDGTIFVPRGATVADPNSVEFGNVYLRVDNIDTSRDKLLSTVGNEISRTVDLLGKDYIFVQDDPKSKTAQSKLLGRQLSYRLSQATDGGTSVTTPSWVADINDSPITNYGTLRSHNVGDSYVTYDGTDVLSVFGYDTETYEGSSIPPVSLADQGRALVNAPVGMVEGVYNLGKLGVTKLADEEYSPSKFWRPLDYSETEGGSAAEEYFGFLNLGGVLGLIGKAGRTKYLDNYVLKLSEANINKSGKTVLGHFESYGKSPGYIDKAKARGASYFDLGKTWDKLSESERKAANMHFLDKISKQGDQVLLSVPKTKIRSGSILSEEIKYLIKEKGYVWINQWSLKKR